jgi:hypothetical protein
MPWLFNPQNMTQTLTMRNGKTLRLPARKRHYLVPQLMSPDIQAKTKRGLVRNLGEDRVVNQQGVKSDTSSSHHTPRDMVGSVSEESVTDSKPSKKRSARKRTTEKNASTGKKKKSGQ